MIVVTYKEIDIDGVVHLPYRDIWEAEKKANSLYKEGYLNVKVVEIEEKVLYTPGGK